MKIIIHETSYKLKSKNINCNNYHIVRMKRKNEGYVYLILFLCMFLTTGALYAQIRFDN